MRRLDISVIRKLAARHDARSIRASALGHTVAVIDDGGVDQGSQEQQSKEESTGQRLVSPALRKRDRGRGTKVEKGKTHSSMIVDTR